MTQPAVYKLGLVQNDNDDDDKVSPVCIDNDLCVVRGDELSDD